MNRESIFKDIENKKVLITGASGGIGVSMAKLFTIYGASIGLHYSAAKAAVNSLTIGFAREGAKYNILVNSSRCGVIDSKMHTKIKGYNETNFKKRIELIPLKRVGQPIDIARMALFLASESGNFITGEIFTVAGGD